MGKAYVLLLFSRGQKPKWGWMTHLNHHSSNSFYTTWTYSYSSIASKSRSEIWDQDLQRLNQTVSWGNWKYSLPGLQSYRPVQIIITFWRKLVTSLQSFPCNKCSPSPLLKMRERVMQKLRPTDKTTSLTILFLIGHVFHFIHDKF